MNNRNAFFGKLIVALIIAAFGFMAYFMQVQKNPITGEMQHVSMSPDQEIRLGLQSAPMMTRQMGGEVSTSDPRYLEVKKNGGLSRFSYCCRE